MARRVITAREQYELAEPFLRLAAPEEPLADWEKDLIAGAEAEPVEIVQPSGITGDIIEKHYPENSELINANMAEQWSYGGNLDRQQQAVNEHLTKLTTPGHSFYDSGQKGHADKWKGIHEDAFGEPWTGDSQQSDKGTSVAESAADAFAPAGFKVKTMDEFFNDHAPPGTGPKAKGTGPKAKVDEPSPWAALNTFLESANDENFFGGEDSDEWATEKDAVNSPEFAQWFAKEFPATDGYTDNDGQPLYPDVVVQEYLKGKGQGSKSSDDDYDQIQELLKPVGTPPAAATPDLSGMDENLQNFFLTDADEGNEYGELANNDHFKEWFDQNYPSFGHGDMFPQDVVFEYECPWNTEDYHSQPVWMQNMSYGGDADDEIFNWQKEVGPEQIQEWVEESDSGGLQAISSFHKYLDNVFVAHPDDLDVAMYDYNDVDTTDDEYDYWKDQLPWGAEEYFAENPQQGAYDYSEWKDYYNGDTLHHKSSWPSGPNKVNYDQMYSDQPDEAGAPDSLIDGYDSFVDGFKAYMLTKYPSLEQYEINNFDRDDWADLEHGWNNLSQSDKYKLQNLEGKDLHPSQPDENFTPTSAPQASTPTPVPTGPVVPFANPFPTNEDGIPITEAGLHALADTIWGNSVGTAAKKSWVASQLSGDSDVASSFLEKTYPQQWKNWQTQQSGGAKPAASMLSPLTVDDWNEVIPNYTLMFGKSLEGKSYDEQKQVLQTYSEQFKGDPLGNAADKLLASPWGTADSTTISGAQPQETASSTFHQQLVTSPEFKAWFKKDNSGFDLDDPSAKQQRDMLLDSTNDWTMGKLIQFKNAQDKIKPSQGAEFSPDVFALDYKNAFPGTSYTGSNFGSPMAAQNILQNIINENVDDGVGYYDGDDDFHRDDDGPNFPDYSEYQDAVDEWQAEKDKAQDLYDKYFGDDGGLTDQGAPAYDFGQDEAANKFGQLLNDPAFYDWVTGKTGEVDAKTQMFYPKYPQYALDAWEAKKGQGGATAAWKPPTEMAVPQALLDVDGSLAPGVLQWMKDKYPGSQEKKDNAAQWLGWISGDDGQGNGWGPGDWEIVAKDWGYADRDHWVKQPMPGGLASALGQSSPSAAPVLADPQALKDSLAKAWQENFSNGGKHVPSGPSYSKWVGELSPEALQHFIDNPAAGHADFDKYLNGSLGGGISTYTPPVFPSAAAPPAFDALQAATEYGKILGMGPDVHGGGKSYKDMSYEEFKDRLATNIKKAKSGSFYPEHLDKLQALYNKLFGQPQSQGATPQGPVNFGDTAPLKIPASAGITPATLMSGDDLNPDFQKWLWDKRDKNMNPESFLAAVKSWTPEHWQAVEDAFLGTGLPAAAAAATPVAGSYAPDYDGPPAEWMQKHYPEPTGSHWSPEKTQKWWNASGQNSTAGDKWNADSHGDKADFALPSAPVATITPTQVEDIFAQLANQSGADPKLPSGAPLAEQLAALKQIQKNWANGNPYADASQQTGLNTLIKTVEKQLGVAPKGAPNFDPMAFAQDAAAAFGGNPDLANDGFKKFKDMTYDEAKSSIAKGAQGEWGGKEEKWKALYDKYFGSGASAGQGAAPVPFKGGVNWAKEYMQATSWTGSSPENIQTKNIKFMDMTAEQAKAELEDDLEKGYGGEDAQPKLQALYDKYFGGGTAAPADSGPVSADPQANHALVEKESEAATGYGLSVKMYNNLHKYPGMLQTWMKLSPAEKAALTTGWEPQSDWIKEHQNDPYQPQGSVASGTHDYDKINQLAQKMSHAGGGNYFTDVSDWMVWAHGLDSDQLTAVLADPEKAKKSFTDFLSYEGELDPYFQMRDWAQDKFGDTETFHAAAKDPQEFGKLYNQWRQESGEGDLGTFTEAPEIPAVGTGIPKGENTPPDMVAADGTYTQLALDYMKQSGWPVPGEKFHHSMWDKGAWDTVLKKHKSISNSNGYVPWERFKEIHGGEQAAVAAPTKPNFYDQFQAIMGHDPAKIEKNKKLIAEKGVDWVKTQIKQRLKAEQDPEKFVKLVDLWQKNFGGPTGSGAVTPLLKKLKPGQPLNQAAMMALWQLKDTGELPDWIKDAPTDTSGDLWPTYEEQDDPLGSGAAPAHNPEIPDDLGSAISWATDKLNPDYYSGFGIWSEIPEMAKKNSLQKHLSSDYFSDEEKTKVQQLYDKFFGGNSAPGENSAPSPAKYDHEGFAKDVIAAHPGEEYTSWNYASPEKAKKNLKDHINTVEQKIINSELPTMDGTKTLGDLQKVYDKWFGSSAAEIPDTLGEAVKWATPKLNSAFFDGTGIYVTNTEEKKKKALQTHIDGETFDPDTKAKLQQIYDKFFGEKAEATFDEMKAKIKAADPGYWAGSAHKNKFDNWSQKDWLGHLEKMVANSVNNPSAFKSGEVDTYKEVINQLGGNAPAAKPSPKPSPKGFDEDYVLKKLQEADPGFWNDDRLEELKGNNWNIDKWKGYVQGYQDSGNDEGYPAAEMKCYEDILEHLDNPGASVESAAESPAAPAASPEQYPPGISSWSGSGSSAPPSMSEIVKGQISTLVDKLRAPESQGIYNDDDIRTAQSPEFQQWFRDAPASYRQTTSQFPSMALEDFAKGGEYGWVPESTGDIARVYDPYAAPAKGSGKGGWITTPSGERLRLPGYGDKQWPGHTFNPESTSRARPPTKFPNRPPDVPGQLEIPLPDGSSWVPDKKFPELRRGVGVEFNRYEPGNADHKLLTKPGIVGERHRAAARLMREIRELMIGPQPGRDDSTSDDYEKAFNAGTNFFDPPWTLFDAETQGTDFVDAPPKPDRYNPDSWLEWLAFAQKNDVPPEQMWDLAKQVGSQNPEKYGTPPQSYLIAQSHRDPAPMAKEISRLIGEEFTASDLSEVSKKLKRIRDNNDRDGDYDQKTRNRAEDLYDKYFGQGFVDDLLAHKILEYVETGAYKPSDYRDHPNVGGMGSHWTTHDESQFGSGRSADEDGFPLEIVIDWPGAGEDPDRKDAAWDYPSEKEISLNPGTPVIVKRIRFKHPRHGDTEDSYGRNRWITHEFTPHKRHASVALRRQGRAVVTHQERFAVDDDPGADFDVWPDPYENRAINYGQPTSLKTPRYDEHTRPVHDNGEYYFSPDEINPPSNAASRPDIKWIGHEPEQDVLPDIDFPDEVAPGVPVDRHAQPLFRGLSLDLNHPDAAEIHRMVYGQHPDDQHMFDLDHEPQARYDHPELARAILDHLENSRQPTHGLGRHWSVDPSEAHGFAISEALSLLNDPDSNQLPVRLRADWKGAGENPYRHETGEAGNEFFSEMEMNMLPGANMNIGDVQIRHPDLNRWVSLDHQPQHRHAQHATVRPRNAKRILTHREMMEG